VTVAQAAVERGRVQAEALMKDSVVVSRPGAPVTDPDTGVVTVPLVDVYAGPCKVQQTISQSSNPTAGGHAFTVQSARLDVPVWVTGVAIGDIAVASFLDTATYPGGSFPGEDVYPAEVRELTFRVIELFEKSYATSQRLRVERVTA
jgi:hypothetical protein